MKIFLITLAFFVPQGATPAVGKPEDIVAFDCSFGAECTDDECKASTHRGLLFLFPPSHQSELRLGTWIDPSGVVNMIGTGGTAIRMSWAAHEIFTGGFDANSDDPLRLLTIAKNGAARYISLNSDPIRAVSYIGHCEGPN